MTNISKFSAQVLFALLTVSHSFGIVAAAESIEVYVAVDGDDSHVGSVDKPLQTIGRAQAVVRELLSDDRQRDVTVFLRRGTFYLEKPLVFTVDDCAGDGHSVTYTAFPGEEAIISGGRPIGPWRTAGESWTAEVPTARGGKWPFRELFVAGKRGTRVRTPNDGYYRVVKAGADNRTSFQFKPGDLKNWPGLESAELVFLHDWSTSRVRFKAVQEAENIAEFTQPIGSAAPHYAISHFESHPRYFVENIAELLDAPGEWFLNDQSGEIRYRPRTGESPDRAVAIAPHLESLVAVTGDVDSGRPVRGLRWKGVTFSHCHWPLPSGGYAAGQAGFHDIRDTDGRGSGRRTIPAAVTFDLAEDCVLEDCRFEHLGGAAIHFRQTCRNNRMLHCTVNDVAGNGIMIGETFTRKGSDADAQSDLVCRGNVVQDCTVEHCGAEYYGCVGIWVGIAADTLIAHNEIRHLPYTGISVGWMWNPSPTGCRGNRIEHNHIHHVMQILSDGGGIYTLGRQPGMRIAGNVIHDVPLNAGRAESNGMFLDEGTTELVIEDNLIFADERAPLRFHQALENTVRHNVLVTTANVPIVRYNSTSPEKISLVENEVVEAAKWRPAAVALTERQQKLLDGAGVRHEE